MKESQEPIGPRPLRILRNFARGRTSLATANAAKNAGLPSDAYPPARLSHGIATDSGFRHGRR